MNQITLQTAGGEHVGWFRIPAFNRWPDVVFYGQRVFRFHEASGLAPEATYREAFGVAVVEEALPTLPQESDR